MGLPMNEPKLSEILHEIQLVEIHKQVVRVAAGLRVLMILTEKEWEGSGHSSVAWLKGCLAMPCREDMLMPKIQEKMAGKSLQVFTAESIPRKSFVSNQAFTKLYTS